MQVLDNKFFEEYKRLEKLCSDMYSCNSGVSGYIADMEQKAARGERMVPSWANDYKMLKHVRWARNRIAHDTTGEQFSEASDLAFVQEFYGRILKGQDSLALLRAAEAKPAKQPRPSARPYQQPYEYRQTQEKPHKKKHKGVTTVILMLFTILLLVYLYVVYFYR